MSYFDDNEDRIVNGYQGRLRGTQAGKATAAARCTAHSYFDLLWQTGSMSRSEAYAWLAKKLGIPSEQCHMEQMDRAMCERVVHLCVGMRFEAFE